MSENVGLIGVGTMGSVILDRLCGAGYSVYAADPAPGARKRIETAGASFCGAPAEVVGTSELILLSLPAPMHIETVVTGERGLLEEATEKHIIVDTSTVDPETSRMMAERLAATGASYLDAPILGRPVSIGNWVLPVGGEASALKRAEPVLSIFAKNLVHVGPSGAGNTLKLLNQLMFSTINGITAEVMAIAEKAGLSRKVFFETVADSGAATVSGLFKECGRKITDGDYSAVFPIELLCKDAGLGIEMARSFGAHPVIASEVQMLNEIARDTGLGSLDTSGLVKLFERLYSSAAEQGESR